MHLRHAAASVTALAVALALAIATGVTPASAQSQLGGASDNGAQDVTPYGAPIAVPPAPAIIATPISPPMPPAPVTPAPPGLVQASPPADSTTDTGSTDTGNAVNMDNGTPGQPAPGGTGQSGTGQADSTQNPGQNLDQDAIPAQPNDWQPGKFAKIGVLDKVGGGVTELSIPVGGQSVVGDLQVNVLACVIRPPDQLPDAAVFLALQNTDNLSGPPNYRGWLMRSAPGAAVAGDASETFRVIDCS